MLFLQSKIGSTFPLVLCLHTECARGAGANIMPHEIDACASILARMRLTLIDFSLTVLSSKAWHAL